MQDEYDQQVSTEGGDAGIAGNVKGSAAVCPPLQPQAFTQPKLFICLVLKTFFKTVYRRIETMIPPMLGRPTTPSAAGCYRWLMSERFDIIRYGQRWQVETVFSMIKRNLGSALRSRTY